MRTKYGIDDIKGVVVPIFTPIDKEENVDYPALKRLLEHIIGGGANGIFVMGSSGEFARFDTYEREKLMSTVIEMVDNRLPVYAGISDCGTRLVMKNIRTAERLGADFLVTTLPYYYSIKNYEEQVSFFTDVADSSNLPVLMYNIPQNVNSKIKLETIQAMSKHSNIAGVKDSTGDFDLMKTLLEQRTNPDFKVFVGKEAVAKYGLVNGADGIVPSMANVYPKLFSVLYNSVMVGDLETAEKCQKVVDEVNTYNTCTDSAVCNFIVRKQLLSDYGIMNQYMTRPRLTLSDDILKKLSELAEKYREWAL